MLSGDKCSAMVDERTPARNLKSGAARLCGTQACGANISRMVQKTWILCLGWQSRAVKIFRQLCGRVTRFAEPSSADIR